MGVLCRSRHARRTYECGKKFARTALANPGLPYLFLILRNVRHSARSAIIVLIACEVASGPWSMFPVGVESGFCIYGRFPH